MGNLSTGSQESLSKLHISKSVLWVAGIELQAFSKCVTIAALYLLTEMEPCHAPNNIFFSLELPELSDMSRCVVKEDCYCELLDFILGTKGKKSFSVCLSLFYKLQNAG